jgi:glucose-1-phosphate cytidylyltransferase
MNEYPVVILCGGIGTRLREETEFMPKPLVKVGNRPILWHIMKHYSHFGFNNFILCLGYKGDAIKEYFLNYDSMMNDFTLNLKGKKETLENHTNTTENWNITFADTGFKTLTGGRIKRIEKYIKEDNFLMTYGDGVSDVDITSLIKFHKSKGKIATLTGVHPGSKYGTVHTDKNNIVVKFEEKPILKDLINGGYFVFKKEIFDYIDEDCMLEKGPFENLAAKRQIALFKHDGFWHCMDTYKDFQDLNAIWKTKAPWKIWNN